jgi:hypothetical protein
MRARPGSGRCRLAGSGAAAPAPGRDSSVGLSPALSKRSSTTRGPTPRCAPVGAGRSTPGCSSRSTPKRSGGSTGSSASTWTTYRWTGRCTRPPTAGRAPAPTHRPGQAGLEVVRRRRPRPVRDPTPRHQGPGRQTSAVAARALDRRSHQHLAVQLRATSPQHRPASPPPPRRSVPRHHSPHRRPPHRLAQPLELHVSAYPLKFLAGQGRLSQSPTPGCPGSAWPGRRRPWCR